MLDLTVDMGLYALVQIYRQSCVFFFLNVYFCNDINQARSIPLTVIVTVINSLPSSEADPIKSLNTFHVMMQLIFFLKIFVPIMLL